MQAHGYGRGGVGDRVSKCMTSYTTEAMFLLCIRTLTLTASHPLHLKPRLNFNLSDHKRKVLSLSAIISGPPRCPV